MGDAPSCKIMDRQSREPTPQHEANQPQCSYLIEEHTGGLPWGAAGGPGAAVPRVAKEVAVGGIKEGQTELQLSWGPLQERRGVWGMQLLTCTWGHGEMPQGRAGCQNTWGTEHS